jgi:hypothetical protein
LGLYAIAPSAYTLTIEHLDQFFAWPVALIVMGLVSTFTSWIIPRWRANRKLHR